MRGIAVAAMVAVLRKAPILAARPFRSAHMAQIMDVRAFGMDQFTQHSELRKVEGKHLNLTVAAVLELHAVAFRLFARLDEFPALINGECGRNLREHVLAAAHRAELHGNVKIPRSRVVHDVHIRIFAKFLPCLVAKVLLGGRLFLVGKDLLRLGDLLRHIVADCGHRNSGKVAHAPDHTASTAAHPDHAKSDVRNLRSRKTVHRRTLRATEPAAARNAAGRERGHAHPCRAPEEVSSCCTHFSLLAYGNSYC